MTAKQKQKHYVVQERRRWDITANSMKEAKKMFLNVGAIYDVGNGEVEELTIVEEETGNEESML